MNRDHEGKAHPPERAGAQETERVTPSGTAGGGEASAAAARRPAADAEAAEEERSLEASFLGYALFYGGIIGLIVALGLLMVLLMRFGR
ncbi:MAG: hypothetical protein D6729_00590 [Deltaproteobacteria bacterium]|nr:MAG: hypothetical protein D6729_00590 [Deltaproteobacteria bacterium]